MEQSDLDLLQTVPPYHLQSLMKVRKGLSSSRTAQSTSSSPTTITEIAHILFDPDSLDAALRELTEIEGQILRELVACGGRANSRDLALYFTNAGSLTTNTRHEDRASLEAMDGSARGYPPALAVQYPIAHPHGTFEQALRHLLALGLLFWGRQTNFAGRDYTSGVHDGVVIVPLAVRVAVRSRWEEEMKHLVSASPLPEGGDVGERARALQQTLYLYWSMVAAMREGLPLVSSGLLARSALRHVQEHMGNRFHLDQIRTESDSPSFLFIRLLLMRLGLLQERRGALQAAPAEPFFSLPLAERVRRCYRCYVEDPFWNEMLYLPEVNVRPGPSPLDPAHEEVIRARQTVIERLLCETTDTWCNFSTFIARTKLYAPYLLFPRQYGPRAERYSSGCNPYGWDFRLRRGWLTHREGWHMVEGGFIRAVVSGPLHWLGMTELDRAENSTAFRLSSVSALVTSATPFENDEVAWGRLIVQPNFELVAMAPVSELLLVTLDRFADRVSLEHIAQYRLTKASVTRAIQKGMHADEIQQALEAASGGEIPQNVRYSLNEWERQARRVEIWQNATLLEVDDAALLDELFASEETRALFGRRLAPRLAEVATHHLSAVQQLLWQRDYLPALTTAPEQDPVLENDRLAGHEPQWQLHDNGLLEPLYAVLDLYLVSAIQQFSERDEATGWYHITPSSLHQALQQGLELDYIIRFLQHYCAEGIPASFLIRLKLWGGGYGDQPGINVEHAPLLRLSPQILQDLQDDTEIQQLLGSEIEQPCRLIRVDAANLERVITLLRERGFTVE